MKKKRIGIGIILVIMILVSSTNSVFGFEEFEKIKDSNTIEKKDNKLEIKHDPITTDSNNNSNDSNYKYFENSEKCYGIAIPLIRGENLPYNSIQQSIANMVNDILRLNVPVFWAASNFSVISRKIANSTTEERFFEKGTFIIPFTGDHSTDVLLISIVVDYELGSEIDEFYPVDLYFIMESFSVDAFQLNYAKCAIRYGLTFAYMDVYSYFNLMHSSGFFDIQFILDEEIDDKLNNDDFNIMIWSGGRITKLDYTDDYIKAATFRICNSIRSFVNKGGGYVGSCYGAHGASSGTTIPLFYFHTWFRNLPTVGALGLTSSHAISLKCGAFNTVKLKNLSHPVSFGLDEIQYSFHVGGPVFSWKTMDKNTQVVGVLDNLDVLWWNKDIYDKLPPNLVDRFINYITGKPIWISSNFGKGKAVAFGDHPELSYPLRNDRLIDNTILYVTSGKKTTLNLDNQMPLSEIKEVYFETENIKLSDYSAIFKDIWKQINKLKNTGKQVDDLFKNISFNILRIAESGRDTKGITNYGRESYYIWLDDFSKALKKIEVVYNTSKNVEEINSIVNEWKDKVKQDLDEFNNFCSKLLDSDLLEKIMNYKGSTLEKLRLHKLIDKDEIIYRKGQRILIQLWSSTVSTCRDIWYTFEREYSLKKQINDDLFEEEFVSNISSPFNTDTRRNDGVIFVDDDASAWGNGSSDHPFRSIQDAIEASNDGDTIFVREGIYYEHLFIGKSVKLIGQNKEKTIIDGKKRPHHHISTIKPNIEISGFTIQNSANRQCGMVLYSKENVISGNIFRNNAIGLGCNDVSNSNIIKDNLFVNNYWMGMGIDAPTQTDNLIVNNTFKNNKIGFYTVNVKNTLKDNVFINNGVVLASSTEPLNFQLINNTVNDKPLVCYKNKDDFKITNAGEIILSNCKNGVIDNVTINKTDGAIYVLSSSNIEILNSKISDNLIGVFLQNSDNVVISSNFIINNNWTGLWLYESDESSILNNFIDGNIDGLMSFSSSKNNIKSNNFTNNVLGTTFLSSSKNNKIRKNNFIENNANAFDKCRNQYLNIYWDDLKGHNRLFGRLRLYNVPGRLFMNIDWFPAKEAYDIE